MQNLIIISSIWILNKRIPKERKVKAAITLSSYAVLMLLVRCLPDALARKAWSLLLVGSMFSSKFSSTFMILFPLMTNFFLFYSDASSKVPQILKNIRK